MTQIDVCVYSNLKYRSDVLEEGNFKEVYIVKNESFSGHADELENGVYDGDMIAFFGVHYQDWCDKLGELVGLKPKRMWKKAKSEYAHFNFYKLIDFSDNGVIGPKTSAKLCQDFQINREKAKSSLKEKDFEIYEKWLNGFKIASETNGAVIFE